MSAEGIAIILKGLEEFYGYDLTDRARKDYLERFVGVEETIFEAAVSSVKETKTPSRSSFPSMKEIGEALLRETARVSEERRAEDPPAEESGSHERIDPEFGKFASGLIFQVLDKDLTVEQAEKKMAEKYPDVARVDGGK